MSELAEPFTIATDRRAGDVWATTTEPRPEGYVSYAPTREFVPDRYFFALAVIHAMRCASSIVALIAATQSGNGLAILALSATLTASHGALVVGCYLQRRWAKVGSIVLDVQASFMTIVVLVALSDFELSWSAMVRQVVGPSITIWLAIKARVDRRRRLVTTATRVAG